MTNQTNNKHFKIGIYAHPSSPVSSVAGVWDIFSVARQLAGEAIQIEMTLIGSNHFSQQKGSPISVYPSQAIGSTDYDLIIITAIGPVSRNGVHVDPLLADWLKECSANGTAIATICTGAFLLAYTGLLNNRRATTHWKMATHFKAQFPRVELRTENMLTHDGNFFCSGGAYAFQDLCVYLINTYFGRELAEACSSLLMIELTTRSQLTFSGLRALKEHSDEQVLSVQHWLEENLDNLPSIDEISKRFNMSSRNFVRRFRSATNETPSAYIQKLRIEKAKHLLQSSTETIDSISYKVGYQDVQYFRALFKKYAD